MDKVILTGFNLRILIQERARLPGRFHLRDGT
jgi:hypothetical protein